MPFKIDKKPLRCNLSTASRFGINPKLKYIISKIDENGLFELKFELL